MQTSSRALYSFTNNSATEKCEARANEWRFTTFDFRLSPFSVDVDGPLYTLVSPSYPGHVKLTEEDPALLVSDGHYSRARNLDLTKLGREHLDAVVSLPYSTHKMPPLDLGFIVAFEDILCS